MANPKNLVPITSLPDEIVTGAAVLAEYNLIMGTAASRAVAKSLLLTNVDGDIIIPAGRGLQLKNPANTFHTELKSGAVAANRSWTLPLVDAAGYMKSDGAGAFSLESAFPPIATGTVTGSAATSIAITIPNSNNYAKIEAIGFVTHATGVQRTYSLGFANDLVQTNYYSLSTSWGAYNANYFLDCLTSAWAWFNAIIVKDINNIMRFKSFGTYKTTTALAITDGIGYWITNATAGVTVINIFGAANCLGVGSTFYIFGYPKV